MILISTYCVIPVPPLQTLTPFTERERVRRMGKEEEKEDVEAKIAKYEAYLNDTLRGDLRLCLEERDKLYTEQADLLGKALTIILNEAFPLSQIYFRFCQNVQISKADRMR